MVRLSERLALIASLTEKGETVADIGTDHGLLPLYLYESKKSPHVIFTDISSGSLQKAVNNCRLTHPGACFDFRLGDGLDPIAPGETDVIVCAGMGGILISEMLDWDLAKSRSFGKLILQPRSNCGTLRRWLAANAFVVEGTHIAKEGGRYCEVMLVRPCAPDKADRGRSDEEYEFPDSLIAAGGRHTADYLRGRKAAEAIVTEKIKEGRGEAGEAALADDERYRQAVLRICRIEALLKEMGEV